jgi:HSP20 family protein
MTGDPRRWMWTEACAMIERAEQMHRQFFQPGVTAVPRASWEPPVDIFESERDLLVVVALPGVESQDIEISSGPDMLLVAGVRRLPAAARGKHGALAIQRLEIPHGRFERRIRLPAAHWELQRSTLAEGCLLISLTRQA